MLHLVSWRPSQAIKQQLLAQTIQPNDNVIFIAEACTDLKNSDFIKKIEITNIFAFESAFDLPEEVTRLSNESFAQLITDESEVQNWT